ncbi:MAG: sterol desaturase family protein [Symplocastrum torsivum CPER-KK1]|jgi:sterol desaturase/sphingolipid hydroxylase (fatty acid hydroxylase superfamily)|uniref:Sterol desaturase family protein n=1 Tax=Symplocastrum torsivum CPER-KK1 TaxID=450513 RepID=A0A951PRC9_9CYAN|nr:sterol desaturase family protein [Symplocastrum torsivum CPER-KK1]
MNSAFPTILGCLVLFSVLENLFPFFTFKQSWTSRISTNFAIGLLNAAITYLVFAALSKWVFPPIHWSGLFHGIQPHWLVGIISFLLLDIYRYGWHVLMHMSSLGWRFHRVHHTERTMNISTAYRFHFLEVICSNFPRVFLIWLFGINPVCVFIYDVAFAAIQVFQHSNWAVPLNVDKVLTYFIITPNFHRVHHSQIVKETNSNYGSVLSVWDRLFGTFRYIRHPQTIKIGLSEEPRQLNLLDLLTLPF